MHQPSRPFGPAVAGAVKFILFAALACGPLTEAGAQLYWDTNGATAGSGNAGGDWNAGTNWSTSAAGTVATQAWADGNQAIFSAGSDGVGVLPIDVTGTVTANGIMVRQGTINLRSGTVNSTAANIFVLGGSTLSLTDNVTVNGTNLVLSAVNQSNAQGAPFNADATSMAFLDIADNASLNLNRLDVGNQANGQGTVNMSGGTLTLTGADANGGLRLGHWPGPANTRIFNHTGGTLDSTAASHISIGWDGTQAQYNASGSAVIDASTIRVQRESTFNIQGGADVTATFLDIGTSRGAGNVVMTGGTLNVNGEARVGNEGGGGGSTFTHSGGTVTVTAPLNVGWDGANAQYNASGSAVLNAQTLRVSRQGTLSIADNAQVTATFLDIGTDRQTGHVVMSGGTLDVNGEIRLAHWPAGADSTFTHSGGTVTASSTLSVGWDGTNGQYSASGSAILSAPAIHVQRQGTLSVAGGADITTNSLILGTDRQAGHITMSDGTLNVNGETRIGDHGAGAGSSFTISDGTINATGPWFVGWDAANVTMTVDGGTLNLALLSLRGDNSVLNVNDGTINATSLQLGEAAGRNATGNQAGGDITLSNRMLVGHWPNETSIYNLSGGTLTLTSTAGNAAEEAGIITLGVDGTGIFNHSGGTLTAHGIHLDARGATPGTDLYALTGGTLVLGAYGIQGNADTSTFAVELGGGVVRASADTQILTPVTLTGTNGNVSFDSNGHTINVPGVLSGPGGLEKTGAGTMVLTAVNTFTGGTVVNGGNLDLARPGNSADGTVRGTLTINPGGTVVTSTTNSLGWGATTRVTELNINGGLLDNTATGDQGWNIAINLTGGTLQSNNGVSSTTTGSLFTLGGGSSVNSFASPDTSVIAGRIQLREGNPGDQLVFNVENGASPVDLDVSAAITESVPAGRGITLTGDGTMRLTGATSYTGPTNVQGGTLLMSGDHSAATGPVTVQSGATLGGTGVIGGATLVNDGAVLAPGNSAGTLTFNQDLTLAPGATFEVDVLFGGSATDLVVMAPQTILSVDGATLAGTWGGSDANIFRGTYSADTMFWVVDHQGTAPIDGRFENTTPAPGFAGLFDGVTPYLTTIDGQLFAAFYESQFGNFSQAGLTGGNDLLLMSIPEPSRALLMTIAAATLLLRRRR